MILIALALSSSCPKLFAAILEWDANPEPNIIGYRVHMGTQSGQYDTVVDVGLATEMSIPPLVPGQTCYLAVTAYDADGLESPFSEEVSYTPLIQGTNAVLVPLSMTFLSATKVILISFLGEAGTQYTVQATADFQSWQTIHTIAMPANGLYQWFDTDAPNHSKRFYRVVIPQP